MDDHPRLHAIFFAEFHHLQGPKISFQSPDGFITADSFDGFSEYIITKPQLCGRLVTINTEEYQIVGFPVSIEGKKYPRNGLLFNMGFVFDLDANIKTFEPLVRKVANLMQALEVECEFLFDPEKKARIGGILERLLEDLNSYRECQILIDNANSINLKLFPIFEDPPPIRPYDVPVALIDLKSMVTKDWDLTMRKVVPLIDGRNYVERITEISEVDFSLVRNCIEHLYYYGCIRLVDIFQFSNMYAVTPEIHRLYADNALQIECVQYVGKKDTRGEPFSRLFSLYCSLSNGVTLAEFHENHKIDLLAIDIRRFITFGLVKSFVRRVHKYPVKVAAPYLTGADAGLSKQLKKMLNGVHHYDEICVNLGRSTEEVDEALEQDQHIKYIWS